MQLRWFALVVALTPSLASAALFPKDSLVKQIDAKGFKKVMKENVSAMSLQARTLRLWAYMTPPRTRTRTLPFLRSPRTVNVVRLPVPNKRP